jgi:hypothetical protein
MRPGERRVPDASTRRFGVILPSPDTVAEPEFYRVAPPDVTFHFARVPLERGSDGAMPNLLAEAALAAAALLRDARPEWIAYACTSGSLLSSNLATLWGIIGVHPALSRLGRLCTTDPEEFS